VYASRGKESKAMTEMRTRQVHYFGDEAAVTEGLEMHNRLTGYVFVVDSQGRIRWRTTGKLTEAESHSMMQAVRKLAPDDNHDVHS
jgi:predicted transcriptional regulator